MTRLLEEIKFDLAFVQSHTLQPKWFKVLKVFLLLGFLGAYYLLFGFSKTALFVIAFFCLSALVHYLYRFKTHKYQQSWLDFVVYTENQEIKYKRIGIFYYCAVMLNALLAFAFSQWAGR